MFPLTWIFPLPLQLCKNFKPALYPPGLLCGLLGTRRKSIPNDFTFPSLSLCVIVPPSPGRFTLMGKNVVNGCVRKKATHATPYRVFWTAGYFHLSVLGVHASGRRIISIFSYVIITLRDFLNMFGKFWDCRRENHRNKQLPNLLPAPPSLVLIIPYTFIFFCPCLGLGGCGTNGRLP